MSVVSLSNRIVISGFGTLIVIFIWVLDWIYGSRDEPVLKSIRLRLGSFKQISKVLVLPVVVTLAFTLFWWGFIGSLPSLDSVQFKIIFYLGFLAPIFEEFVFRGGSIGVVKKYFKLSDYYLPLLVLFSSAFFVWGHLGQSVSPAYFFIISVIYSFLYLYNDYNLLAPIVAHAVSNLVVIGWKLFLV